MIIRKSHPQRATAMAQHVWPMSESCPPGAGSLFVHGWGRWAADKETDEHMNIHGYGKEQVLGGESVKLKDLVAI